jgi:hypothetical protein
MLEKLNSRLEKELQVGRKPTPELDRVKNWQQLQDAVAPSLEGFLQALKNPIQVQLGQLREILDTNRDSVFGRKYGFELIRCYEDYCDRIPIHRYEDLAPYIQRMAAGEQNVLCSEPVVAFEVTGGSTQGAKLIPYTVAGLAAFQRSIFPWIGDLLRAKPQIKTGRTYWAISPVTRQFNKTEGGIPIGMVSDAAYFGKDIETCIAGLLAVPAEFALIADIEEWRYLTALFLLAAKDLSLISVWSPTFLLELLREIREKRDRIIADIASGKSTPHASLPPNRERAKLLETAVSDTTIDTQKIWTQLCTISCWTDAAAKAFVSQLQSLFPHACIQGKGLLATEGVVTLPLVGCQSPVLAIESGFYEFLDANNQPRLCHQLVEGEVYRVVMTTHSGLYRYDIGDRVRVRGWKAQTPLLEFVGRAGLVSDLCGEKLTEEFVLSQLGERRGFTMLAPSLQGKPHYVLFLDAAEYDEVAAAALAHQLDEALGENPQYQYARQLGQLGELVACRVENPMASYINYALERGQRLGDIKPPVLSQDSDAPTKIARAADEHSEVVGEPRSD